VASRTLGEFWAIFQDVRTRAQGCNLGKLDPLGDLLVSLERLLVVVELDLNTKSRYFCPDSFKFSCGGVLSPALD
jgi:hypothetical protein